MGCYRNPWRFCRNNACLLERNHGDEIPDVSGHHVARGCGGCVA